MSSLSRHVRRLLLIGDVLVLCLLGLWAAGHLLGPSPPNRWLALLFLIPAPVAFVPGLLWLLWRRTRAPLPLRRLQLVLVAASGWTFLGIDMAWHCRPPADPRGTFRLVHWNLARPRREDDSLWATLRSDRADVYVLAERPHGTVDDERERLHLPAAHGTAWSELSVVSIHPFEVLERIRTASGIMLCLRVHTPEQDFILIAVDGHSHPFLNPIPLVHAIEEWTLQHAYDVPVIVLGDFNTPRRSPRLHRLRERFRNAYEAAGCGWPYTWPTPLPLVAIDHAWFTGTVDLRRYRIRIAGGSDHARQVLDVAFTAEPNAGRGNQRAPEGRE